MTDAQIFTIIALCIYAAAMTLIGFISYGKTKTLDNFLIGGRKIGAWVTAFSYAMVSHSSCHRPRCSKRERISSGMGLVTRTVSPVTGWTNSVRAQCRP
jgi:hypothetical protein